MDSELARLMPNNLQQGLQDSSINTAEIRKYMKTHPVLTERGNVPAQGLQVMPKSRVDALELRPGTGRVPQAKRFCVRPKRPDGVGPLPAGTANVDPEELKDALLMQAIAQRRALVMGSLRTGSGRSVRRGNYKIVIKPPITPQPLSFDLPYATDQLPAAGTNGAVATSSQLAQLAKTPAGLLGHYPSPVEGVPERLLSAGRRNSRVILGASPMEGISPLEGLGELRQVYTRQQPDPSSRYGSNQQAAFAAMGAVNIAQNDSASPVEGLVQHAVGGTIRGPRLADAGNLNFPSPPARAEIAIQTGTSIQGTAEKAVEDPIFDGAAAPAAFDNDDDDFGGFGGWDDYDDGPGPSDMPFAAPSPAAVAMPPPPPRPKAPRRPVQNPGKNLRKQLPRKSLVENANIGRKEVAPGVRRTTRQPQQPLKWWLGEKKDFSRPHQTMPTVKDVTHIDPNTPWRTVSDPKDWKGSKKSSKAASKSTKIKATKAAGGGKGGAGGRKRKAATVEELDDEIEIRTGPPMPAADSDDEETELLPRGNATVTPASAAGDDEAQGATPTPVRAIDLSSPIDLVSPELEAPAAAGAGAEEMEVEGQQEDAAPAAEVEAEEAPEPSAGPAVTADTVSWGADSDEEADEAEVAASSAMKAASAKKKKKGGGSKKAKRSKK